MLVAATQLFLGRAGFRTNCSAGPLRSSNRKTVSIAAPNHEAIPQSQEESVQQATQAVSSSLKIDKKRRKKGATLWPGVKRLAIEIPIADTSAAVDLALVNDLIDCVPTAAGIPIVVFGSQASTDLARSQDVPFVALSLEECLNEEDEEEELSGPLIILGAAANQCHACRTVVNDLWSGRLLLVVNAAWLREDLPEVDQSFARSLDTIYYFLPIALGGVLGGNKMAYVFKCAKVDGDKWSVFLEESEGVKCVGQMDDKPTGADIEAMVYNASAASSPLTAAAKTVSRLLQAFKK